MKKILITSLAILMLTFNVNAGTDGEDIPNVNEEALKNLDESGIVYIGAEVKAGDNSLTKKKPLVKDCFETVNRATFKFNQIVDGVIFKPIAKAYRILPSPIRSGASNMLGNLSNLVTIPNNVLQGNIKKAGANTGRLVLNTTLGILGIFDVAKVIGLAKNEKEDYGQSLGVWGVSEGCYVVIPVIGPSTVRDSFASIASTLAGGDPWYNVSAGKDTQHFSDIDYWGTKSATGIDFRAKNITSIENLEKNSLDFYASVRSLYLQDRQQKISGTDNSVTESMNDGDWEEIETQ